MNNKPYQLHSKLTKVIKQNFLLFLVATISACGGGSSNEAEPTNSPPVDTTPAETTPLDTTAPQVPQQVTANSASISSISIKWAASTDNVSTTGYRIFRNDNYISQVTEPEYLDEELTEATVYVYTVTALDSAGNESSPSDSVAATTLNSIIESKPKELIANAFSGTSIGLSWLNEGADVSIYRNDIKIVDTSNNFYIDSNLNINTQYTYSVTVGDVSNDAITATVSTKTLLNNTNDGMDNGSETIIVNDRISNFDSCNNERNSLNVSDDILDTCLRAMLEHNSMASHLEDLRAFSARVRSEQDPAMVELGMRLFHSKSLSAKNDTSCSSCHHPAVGCGGDDLSMPIGVNADDETVIGIGRSDTDNSIPIIPRNSQATCNSGLWTRGLFWDNRVTISRGGLTTESSEVTSNTITQVADGATLTLLTAQAHFPVTAAPEMGDIADFGYDDTNITEHTAYRENVLADNLNTEAWGPLFSNAFGNSSINYSRVAEAIAAYEAVQIFIDNPFFDYVDGNENALSIDEKRGAITFMASSSGCTFCHSGAFFTTQAPLPGNYPQIGIGKETDNADLGAVGATGTGAFRAPTLLNVSITGPWGHNGQFATLKRNVEHYKDHGESIAKYFAESEMCDLAQFSKLEDCSNLVAPTGLELSEAILAGNVEFSNNLSSGEVDLIVKFLATLTDPDAKNINSNAIQSLIPTRDKGPDGNQLDAKDINGNEL